MNARDLICPVSNERVNERVIRANAFFTILLIVAAIFFNMPWLLLLLAADFYVRAFTSWKTSPIGFVSQKVVSALGLNLKSIDKAPKIFAARLGFLMSFTTALLFISGASTAATALAAILVLFASLELIAGFCAGCYIYSFVIIPMTSEKQG
jgi:hypothetical protein